MHQSVSSMYVSRVGARSQGGTTEDERPHSILVEEDGSVIIAGGSRGDWGGPNAGSGDFAAVKLDENGDEVWRWQVTRTRASVH